MAKSKKFSPTGQRKFDRLERYAVHDHGLALCRQFGLDHAKVLEAYNAVLDGQLSPHRALIQSGLSKAPYSAGIGVDGDPDNVAERLINRLGLTRAKKIAAAINAHTE